MIEKTERIVSYRKIRKTRIKNVILAYDAKYALRITAWTWLASVGCILLEVSTCIPLGAILFLHRFLWCVAAIGSGIGAYTLIIWSKYVL